MTDTPDAPATILGLMQRVKTASLCAQIATLQSQEDRENEDPKTDAAFKRADDALKEVEAYARRLAAPVQPQKHEANSVHLGLPSGHDESAQLPEPGSAPR